MLACRWRARAPSLGCQDLACSHDWTTLRDLRTRLYVWFGTVDLQVDASVFRWIEHAAWIGFKLGAQRFRCWPRCGTCVDATDILIT